MTHLIYLSIWQLKTRTNIRILSYQMMQFHVATTNMYAVYSNFKLMCSDYMMQFHVATANMYLWSQIFLQFQTIILFSISNWCVLSASCFLWFSLRLGGCSVCCSRESYWHWILHSILSLEKPTPTSLLVSVDLFGSRALRAVTEQEDVCTFVYVCARMIGLVDRPIFLSRLVWQKELGFRI